MNLVRLIAIAVGLVFIWQVIIILTGVPPFILPGPLSVLYSTRPFECRQSSLDAQGTVI